jgi:protein-tyrosine-phosphatase
MGGASGERTKADNAEEAELLASLQNPDINVHDIYSALVREGLFDAGDEILAVDPASASDNPAVTDSAESPSVVNETVLNEDDEKLIEDDNAASPSEKDESF